MDQAKRNCPAYQLPAILREFFANSSYRSFELTC